MFPEAARFFNGQSKELPDGTNLLKNYELYIGTRTKAGVARSLLVQSGMMNSVFAQAHSFHIPVMGIGFTIDTPIRLAPLGIESCISLVNDDVLEAARKHHSQQRLLPFTPIERDEQGWRAKRVRAYLELVKQLVDTDTERLRRSSFEDPRGIRRYFEILPEGSSMKSVYRRAESLPAGALRDVGHEVLRGLVRPGRIGVNIMTKLDGSTDRNGAALPQHDSEAHAALRGFAESDLDGFLVLSAGANPGLFAYLAEFEDFYPDSEGRLKKEIVLKVSDFRSAHVQGRMLARRGLWVSEYRLESGLNCGGHAFPTEGKLMGPILETFRERREDLREGLFAAYSKAIQSRGGKIPEQSPPVRVSAQGGVGTASEHNFLKERFALDSVGWGSPFLMVPEAVILDERTRNHLIEAKKEEVKLSWSSPLGVRFWWLTTCASEDARKDRIERGYPGSVCTARHVALNTEYPGLPLCKGSRAYQKRKMAELDPRHPDYHLQLERLQAPACICVDLCGSFLEATGEDAKPPPAICPGPNIVNFQGTFAFEDLVQHIYGKKEILTRPDRPHMFLRELELYLEVFDEDLEVLGTAVESATRSHLEKTLDGLEEGILFYHKLLFDLPGAERPGFSRRLMALACAVARRRDALELRSAPQNCAG